MSTLINVEHRKLTLILAVIAMVVAACGASQAEVPAPTSQMTVQEGEAESPVTTESPGRMPTTTTSEPATTAELSDRPIAPDFTLELGTGGSYTLSESDKPVYLIFWAEW